MARSFFQVLRLEILHMRQCSLTVLPCSGIALKQSWTSSSTRWTTSASSLCSSWRSPGVPILRPARPAQCSSLPDLFFPSQPHLARWLLLGTCESIYDKIYDIMKWLIQFQTLHYHLLCDFSQESNFDLSHDRRPIDHPDYVKILLYETTFPESDKNPIAHLWNEK